MCIYMCVYIYVYIYIYVYVYIYTYILERERMREIDIDFYKWWCFMNFYWNLLEANPYKLIEDLDLTIKN